MKPKGKLMLDCPRCSGLRAFNKFRRVDLETGRLIRMGACNSCGFRWSTAEDHQHLVFVTVRRFESRAELERLTKPKRDSVRVAIVGQPYERAKR